MVVGSVIGAGMVMSSLIGVYLNREAGQFRQQLQIAFHDAKVIHKKPNGVEEAVTIQTIKKTDYGYTTDILLPNGLPISKFKHNLEAVALSMFAEVRFKHLFGRKCRLEFGQTPIYEKMNFKSELLNKKVLGIPLYSQFGIQYVNFWDEASCHWLIGGATRMGKSILIQLIVTSVMIQTRGKAAIKLINNKMEDTFTFDGFPQIEIASEQHEAEGVLLEVMKEVKVRQKILRQYRDSENVHVFRKKHPDIQMPPIIVIVDEFGRFADNKIIQELIMQIAETAGYLDVHLVIASQRPDAQTVLEPRIKGNFLTRFCFTTADIANSKVVLDIEDAAHLGGIKGRAILVDGLPIKVQAPYLSKPQVHALLKDYRSGQHEQSRQEDTGSVKTLPYNEQETLGETGLPGSSEPATDDKHGDETPEPGRTRKSNSAADWEPTPLLFESTDDQPPLDADTPQARNGRRISWFRLPKNFQRRTDDWDV